MKSIHTSVAHFLSDEQGATAIEYGLLAGLIAVVIIVAVTAIGTNLKAVFKMVGDCLATPKGTLCPTT
jgi:pilus assembly protein Flp/PilA